MNVIEKVKSVFRGKGRPERRRFAMLDGGGAEKLDSTPMQPPLGYNPQPSMFDVMKDMIRREREQLEREGFETPEEADDFDIDDDVDPESPYEHSFDPPAEPERLPQNELPKEAPPQTVPPAKPAPRKSKDVDTVTVPRDEYEALKAPREP